MDTTITDLADSLGVRNYIVYIPLVYGQGSGFGHRLSVQIPTIIRAARESRKVHHLEPANYAWPIVHVEDLARFYIWLGHLIVDANLQLPFGKHGGHYFASTGSINWFELSSGVARAMYKRDLVDQPTSSPWTEKEAAKGYNMTADFVREIWGKCMTTCRFIYDSEHAVCTGSNVNWMAERGVIMGWEPQYSREYLLQHFKEELDSTLQDSE